MSSVLLDQRGPPTPPQEPAFVQLHALQAGRLTLPERFFVHPASGIARRTVPSLAFLIQHEDADTGRITRILFDLGLRREVRRYPEPIQRHIETRQPLSTQPDVMQSLAVGGLIPEDIDYIIYSHVHWDHVGEPRDFNSSTFVIGHGALDLLHGKSAAGHGSHSFFESDLIPSSRTIELASPAQAQSPIYLNDKNFSKLPSVIELGAPDFHQPWTIHSTLHHTIDIFHDGSLLIVDAPGHLAGHINILARTGLDKRVYLAGDACHDRRIMRQERSIGEWNDMHGNVCCIHANRAEAEKTIERVRRLEDEGVEVIFAHDVEWEEEETNAGRFFGRES